MKIWILTPSLDTRVGGVERFSSSLVNALDSRYQVQCVAVKAPAPRVISQVGGHHLWYSRQASELVNSLAEPGDVVISSGTLGASIRRDVSRVHVLHGTMIRAGWAGGVKIRDKIRGVVGGGLAEVLSSRRSSVVAVSDPVAWDARRFYNVDTAQVIENGVDTSVFKPRSQAESRRELGLPAEGRFALFVGRPERRKGIDIAAAVASRCGYELLTAGVGHVTGSVQLGSLDPDQLAVAYAASDCVLFPTRYEACSYVVLEAMASGVPIVTTPVGWSKKIPASIPEYGNLIVAPEVDAASKALLSLRHGDYSKAVSAARKLVVSENSKEAFDKNWVSLIESL